MLAASTAHADTAAQSGALTYPADFFANARPNTAYDMIGRLPAFVFDDGNTQRGFAGTAGNVLIDGQRPTSKTDDLQSILQRIPASDVERIDLIRGGAPGIDMQGQTVVANVVRKKTDSTKIVADISDNIWLGDHHTVPQISVQFTQHSGDSTFEASATRYGNYDDSVGKGFHDLTDVATGVVTHQAAHDTGRGAGEGLTGAATVPLFGGQFKANLALQDSPFDSTVVYTAPGFDQHIADRSRNRNGELGLNWNGFIGNVHLEALVLQRLGLATDLNTSDAPGDDERFHSSADTGESIARVTLRWLPIPSLTLEGGGEGAYNFLNGTSSFIDNGALVPIPAANSNVNEKRGEVFGQGTWKISSEWLLEAGARFEVSTISDSIGDKRTFFYPKPRAVLTWSPDADTQLRLRYERVLGQLDFNNFLASSSLSSTGVTAGNVNLRPDQHTQYEFSYERHFLSKGSIVATFMHEEIKDVVDFVPITNSSATFDAPGNIGNGTNNEFIVNLLMPLDWAGLDNGLLKWTNTFNMTNVHDPVTGQHRVISGQRPQDIELTLTQDIASLKSTWGIFYYNCWDEHYFRLEQTRHRSVAPPFLEAWWSYKPQEGTEYRLELDNFVPFVYDDKLFDFSGPRNTSTLQQIEELHIKSQPRIYLEVRKTF